MQSTLSNKRTFPYVNALIGLYLLIFTVTFMFLGETAIDCANQGVVVFRDTVMPAILPFAFAITFFNATMGKDLTSLFSPIAKRLKFSPDGFYIYFIGLLGGTPLGTSASISAYKNGAISSQETLKLICLTSVASPLLTITCVGKLTYGSFIVGTTLFASQIISAIICHPLLCDKKVTTLPISKNSTKLFDDYIISIVKSLATNCVLTIFFYTAVSLTVKTNDGFILFENTLLKGLLTGIFETNYGLDALSLIRCPTSYGIANAVLTFGGLPVVIQTVVLTNQLKIRTTHIVFFKLAQSLICFLLTFILTNFLLLLRLF